MNKKGISTIVASVLIVLITVAAVTLLWAGLLPILSKAAFIEDPNLRFTIDTKNSYTVYDNVNGFLNIRITRGGDTSEVVALRFIIDIDGSSIVRVVRDDNVVKPGISRVYQFAIGFYDKIDSVKVVPVYLYKGEEIDGSMYTLEQRIPTKPNDLDDQIGNFEPDGIEMSDGLIFYYSFDEPPTGDGWVMDLSGYNHTGAKSGGVTFLEDGEIPNRNLGGAYYFDGTNGYIEIMTLPSGDSLDKEEKTIAFWAKPECKLDSSIFGSYQNYQITFSDVCSSVPVLPNSDSITTYFKDESNLPINRYFDTVAIEQNTWHHYAIVFKITNDNPGFDDDDVTMILYIDGEEKETNSSENIGYGTVDTNFYLGTTSADASGTPAPTRYFKGTVDEFRIYDKPLDIGEITQLMEITEE